MKFILSIFTLLLVGTFACNGQNKTIKGSVYSFKDLPLKNIQITSKKTKTTVLSDSLGNFSINYIKNDKLTFVGSGFDKVTKKVSKKEVMKVQMVFKKGTKNEEVAVLNGHVTKDRLSNSIANYSDYNTDFSNYPDIFSMIQGKFSGVSVVSHEGGKRVYIRGTSSSVTDNTALYVIDGVIIQDISNIEPMDIKTIKVLKNAAIYGSRGGNGAIVITTKGG